MEIFEVSRYGFQARTHKLLPLNIWCDAIIQLGRAEVSRFRVLALREKNNGSYCYYGFSLGEPDISWRKFVSALNHSTTFNDLDTATRFL